MRARELHLPVGRSGKRSQLTHCIRNCLKLAKDLSAMITTQSMPEKHEWATGRNWDKYAANLPLYRMRLTIVSDMTYMRL